MLITLVAAASTDLATNNNGSEIGACVSQQRGGYPPGLSDSATRRRRNFAGWLASRGQPPESESRLGQCLAVTIQKRRGGKCRPPSG
jgi:hypothetical protein